MRTRFLLPFLLFGVLGASVACQVGPQPVSSVTPAAVPPTAAPKATVVGKSFAAADPVIQIGKQYTATLKTDKGDIVLTLRADKAPVTVNSFVFLARKGYFDGLKFHRVEPGFVIQGGDPLGNGTGGPGYETEEDINDLTNLKGTVSMAKNTGSTKVGSQFFINLADNVALDQTAGAQKRFYPFAQVTAGMDVAALLKRDDVIRSVVITEK